MVYSAAPWTFTGRALYQLQLVRSEEARKYIPEDFKLVECLGWTLGGVYLARYDDSPVGQFDECVVMAGLVWNPPTSCAWAARVFVSNKEARDHGLRHVGLPSRLAAFDGTPLGPAGPSPSSSLSSSSKRPGGPLSWWRKGRQQSPPDGASTAPSGLGAKLLGGGFVEAVELHSAERGRRALQLPVATFLLPKVPVEGFLGPRMRLSLPSFSGGTAEHPSLLEYSCDLQTSVMPVRPMTIQLHHGGEGAPAAPAGAVAAAGEGELERRRRRERRRQWPFGRREAEEGGGTSGGEVLDALLRGKPLVTLAFSDMVMKVEEPIHLRSPAIEQAPRPIALLASQKP